MGYATDLGRARNGKFFDRGLDTPNHLDPLQQNSFCAKSPAPGWINCPDVDLRLLIAQETRS
jgi:hypothetical protein